MLSPPHMSSPPHPPLKGRKGGFYTSTLRESGDDDQTATTTAPLPHPWRGKWGKDKIINRRESRGIATTTTTTKTIFFNPWCLIAITDINMWGGGGQRRGRICWYRLPLVLVIEETVIRIFGGGNEQGGLSLLSPPLATTIRKEKIFTSIVLFRSFRFGSIVLSLYSS